MDSFYYLILLRVFSFVSIIIFYNMIKNQIIFEDDEIKKIYYKFFLERNRKRKIKNKVYITQAIAVIISFSITTSIYQNNFDIKFENENIDIYRIEEIKKDEKK